jgi:hypothetical protein
MTAVKAVVNSKSADKVFTIFFITANITLAQAEA